MKWLLYKQQEVLQNLNHSFYQEDLAYVHDMGYGEHAKHAGFLATKGGFIQ